MKRLVTSDWQLCDNPRDRYRTDFVVKTLPDLIDKYNVDQLLVLGDITEQKDNHPAPLVNEIVRTFEAISKKCEIIILEGNHDYLHEGFPFFEFLKYTKNISWISKPTERDNCLYLPHTRDYKKEWKGLKFDGCDFVFAHNIFTGVNTQTGHALSGISPSVFPDDALIISGDVHDPQTIADGKIIYAGSPCLCDFGDDYQPRVLLLDDLKVKSIKVYGQQKRLIQLYWPNDIELPYEKVNENDIVKIQVHISMENVSQWIDIRSKVEDWAAKRKWIVNTIQPIVSYVQGERKKIVKSQKKSDGQYLQSFVQRTGTDERTAQIGKEIVELL